MTTFLHRSISKQIRENLNWQQLWKGPDNGLIYCWGRGRQLSVEKPEIAARADNGELVMLWWRGGVEQKLKSNVTKYGTLNYLATWQGLRGEDLHIDIKSEFELVCSKTGQAVTYRLAGFEDQENS
jgi:hypothetical protein